MTDLRLGRWQDVLSDVECDALITDPPFSARTHSAYSHKDMQKLERKAIDYDHWTEADVVEFVEHWSPRVRGWMVVMTDHVLAPIYERVLGEQGRYVFSPLAAVERGRSVRVRGDGPSQWTTWLIVARPRTKLMASWGTLPGAYVVPRGSGPRRKRGHKPLWLLTSLVRDYTRKGDLVCDPMAGSATTLKAAVIEKRRGIGAEVNPLVYRASMAGLEVSERSVSDGASSVA